ncbi:hypothetical protein MMH89_03030 [Candidatus Comchoanobacter bicostacola]|uniref:Lipocalin-like domain-containing protein n=1 Tax=Candidatus Comchoanobacter bicostacola TaxID=2919598 RepID=A0ABY5DHJ3_9GAMM|nr:hypothetical protein [Candidatus Comchoanobacter bicostacola]UTC24195.1 hypothetical protein MMH89_03030 [Candidatus Comchoanobacter bicostacola]
MKMIKGILIVACLACTLSVAKNKNAEEFHGGWTQYYQVQTKSGQHVVISHQRNRVCVGQFYCAGKTLTLKNSNINNIRFENLSLRVNSTQLEFEQSLRVANLKILKVSEKPFS